MLEKILNEIFDQYPNGFPGLVISPQGGLSIENPEDADQGYTLLQLQGLVGGWIEIVRIPTFSCPPLGTDLIVVCNEEGRFGEKPNYAAEQILGILFYGTILITDSSRVK